jgi:hypothetical protein
VFDDFPHQRERRGGRGQQQVLSRFQLQPDLDGYLGKTVEFYGIDRCRNAALVYGHEIRLLLVGARSCGT